VKQRGARLWQLVGGPRTDPPPENIDSAKKGKPTWKPAQMLSTVKGVRPGHTPRWVSREPGNLEKKIAEGWTPVNGTTMPSVEHRKPGQVQDGVDLSSAKTYRDLVLMTLPNDQVEARREYFAERTARQTVGIKRELQEKGTKTGGAASNFHGTIVIE
jgi:hypothetical protein